MTTLTTENSIDGETFTIDLTNTPSVANTTNSSAATTSHLNTDTITLTGTSNGIYNSLNPTYNGLRVNGSVVINDRDLEQRLETIERVLGIPERDVNLEKKYPYSKIKQLYEEYIRELEKVRTWDRLKSNHD